MDDSELFEQRFGEEIWDDLFESFYAYLNDDLEESPFDFYSVDGGGGYDHYFSCEYTGADGSVWHIRGVDGPSNGGEIDEISLEKEASAECRIEWCHKSAIIGEDLCFSHASVGMTSKVVEDIDRSAVARAPEATPKLTICYSEED